MPESREQYRLSGKLYIIKSDEEDEQLKKVCTCGLAKMLNYACTIAPVDSYRYLNFHVEYALPR